MQWGTNKQTAAHPDPLTELFEEEIAGTSPQGKETETKQESKIELGTPDSNRSTSRNSTPASAKATKKKEKLRNNIQKYQRGDTTVSKLEKLLWGLKDKEWVQTSRKFHSNSTPFTLTETTCPDNSSYKVQDGPTFGNEIVILHSDHGMYYHKLWELKPHFVVLYDVNLAFVRQLEIYKACHPGRFVRVYFVTYEQSVEEQQYLSSLRRETEAFAKLIQKYYARNTNNNYSKEKSHMVISAEQDGKHHVGKMAKQLISENNDSKRNQKSPSSQRIIVDSREFRSFQLSKTLSLLCPYLCPLAFFFTLTVIGYAPKKKKKKKKDIEIKPVTLEVGDYILSPDICVERKSIPDLIKSIQDGRLCQQLTIMSRYYETPILLIEFDPTKSFSLMSASDIPDEPNQHHLHCKIAMFAIHFPQVRFVWSRSGKVTADMFLQLKKQRLQPTVEEARTIIQGGGDGTADESDKAPVSLIAQHSARDILRKLPGVNNHNCSTIINNVTNLKSLCTKTEEELSQWMGASNAKMLYQFLHDSVSVP
ncbi:excision repair cross-complementing rodent repair deficiency, complementation group 4 [Reticulomyxa filosa]|uniref:Excision repair cross-complementing rodent repair deficiency, complementation group 4 n=1 Tax=Reticulomyxa filosa TaxID=46433 RepID=X6M672_RETFI|nr:excision repair cross-complementing rodent repair deficiency, complementation group 4 [Reticulomyxa filosa]|eukprot:ETO09146.1 excision repair cross-complementing rodent repair deficiency, complementation group 4 [Reticulomyxa filosa]